MRERFHKLRLAERPPHPYLLHSPSKTGVNALMARGEKEFACARDSSEFHFGLPTSLISNPRGFARDQAEQEPKRRIKHARHHTHVHKGSQDQAEK